MAKKEESGIEPLKDSELNQVDGGLFPCAILPDELVYRPGKNKGGMISTPATGKNKPVLPLPNMIVDTPVNPRDSSDEVTYLA